MDADALGEVLRVDDAVVVEEVAQVHAQLKVGTVDPLRRVFEAIVQRLYAFIEQLRQRTAGGGYGMLLGIGRKAVARLFHPHQDLARMPGARPQGMLVIFHASRTRI